MSEMSFFDAFSTLKDPRSRIGLRYPLMDVISLAIYGMLCEQYFFTHISSFLKEMDEASNFRLSETFHLKNGVPSHDVFSDVFRGIDVDEFMKCFATWLSKVVYYITGKHIAIDGKALCAATEKAKNGNIPYILSAFMCDLGISIAQIEIGEKKNEISEIPRLIDLIIVEGDFVTIDAIGAQVDIMNAIKEKGADFCLQIKLNQKNTYLSIAELFVHAKEEKAKAKKLKRPYTVLDYYREIDKNHGRIEVREYYVFTNEEEIRMAIDPKWTHVRAVGMAILKRTVLGDTPTESVDVHYHLLSKPITAKEYGALARGHWGIENRLHWVLDNTFSEDRCTSKADNSKFNVSLLKKIAFNFMRLVPDASRKTSHEKMNFFRFWPDRFYKMLTSPIHIDNRLMMEQSGIATVSI